ncbi:MAG TPA: phosphatidylcholine/phosphatidylserine synthase [Burkholderiales bacterium]|nr:phosphatidylcholine/phosphatidylserine synthase [Burkholderiales bacterium]
MKLVDLKRLKYLIPSFFTLCAMLAAFYSVLQSASGSFHAAAYGVIIAMVFDGLDGRSARLTNTCTPFGASFDSITDMMAYGVAPSIMLYCWGLFSLGKFGYIVCFIFCACAGLRLARFNVMLAQVDKRYFQGLSSTIAGGFLVSFILLCVQHHWYSLKIIVLGSIITAISALLMVSNIKFYSFKEVNVSNKFKSFIVASAFVLLLFLIYFFKASAIFSVIALYIIYSVNVHFINCVFHHE